MKADDLRKMSVPELKKELYTLLKEQFNLRIQKGYGQLTKPSQVKKVRRNVARVNTVLTEKKVTGQLT